MASSQKKTKKTTKPAEAKTTTRRRKEAAPAPEPKRTYRREIGAAVCLLSALCVAVSYFNTDAFSWPFLPPSSRVSLAMATGWLRRCWPWPV